MHVESAHDRINFARVVRRRPIANAVMAPAIPEGCCSILPLMER